MATDRIDDDVDVCDIAISVIALINIALQSFPNIVVFLAMSVTFWGANKKRLKRRDERDICFCYRG